MTISINGEKIRKPGVYSSVETEGNIVVTALAKSLCIVGVSEAESDYQKKLLAFRSLREAKDVLGGGDLVTALEVAWSAPANVDYRPGELKVISISEDIDENWDDVIAKLEKAEIDAVVPVTNDSSVVDKFKNHVDEKSDKRKERLLFVSSDDTAVDAIKTKAGTLNYRNCLTVPGNPKLRIGGEVQELDNKFMAVAVAGLWAGTEYGEPITFKRLALHGIGTEYSDDEIEDLIEHGICVVEKVPDRGYRVVRGVTAHDDETEVYKRELSVVAVIDAIIKDLRKSLEDRFTGVKMDQFIVSSVKNFTETKLNTYEDEELIAGLITEEERIPAYRNLEVYRSGIGTIEVEFEASPGEPMNFIKLRATFEPVQ